MTTTHATALAEAQDEATDPTHLTRLSTHEDEAVRGAALRNPSFPVSALTYKMRVCYLDAWLSPSAPFIAATTPWCWWGALTCALNRRGDLPTAVYGLMLQCSKSAWEQHDDAAEMMGVVVTAVCRHDLRAPLHGSVVLFLVEQIEALLPHVKEPIEGASEIVATARRWCTEENVALEEAYNRLYLLLSRRVSPQSNASMGNALWYLIEGLTNPPKLTEALSAIARCEGLTRGLSGEQLDHGWREEYTGRLRTALPWERMCPYIFPVAAAGSMDEAHLMPTGVG